MSHTVLATVRNPIWGETHQTGAVAYAKAVLRYGFQTETPLGAEGNALSIEADGGKHTVPANSASHDLEFVVPVTFGTPGVTLSINFDTGSADLWVRSKEPTALYTYDGKGSYDPKASSTAKEVEGGTWSITYGDGSSASGVIYEDVLRIGDLECKTQGVQVAQKLSSSFLKSSTDGLLGLAWPQINSAHPKQKTPVQNLMEAGVTKEGLFTVCLRHEQDGPGFYSFGAIVAEDAGVKEKDIVYTKVEHGKGFWAFESTKIKVGDHEITLSSNTAIMDTGTTLVLLSQQVVSLLYSQIPNAIFNQEEGGYILPVNSKIPNVQVAVGDEMYTLTEKDLKYGTPRNGMVFGGIQSRGTNDFDIFGDIFLKTAYVVFDQKNSRIGVAQRPSK